MKDRHRPGYFAEYAERTGRKDRHRPGYFDDYNKTRKKAKKKKGKLVWHNGKLCRVITKKVVVKRDLFSMKIDAKLAQWHDDDWEEDGDFE